MIRKFFENFAHPTGRMGALAGWLMAIKNRERNEWAVALLGLQDGEAVLEIGCGPGVALQLMAQQAPGATLSGVDPSAVMIRQAQKRNAFFIQQGQVKLHECGVSQMPFADNSFDKVLTINSAPFWPDLKHDLREARRVLKPGGRLVLVVQPRWVKSDAEVLTVRDEYCAHLAGAGFEQIEDQLLASKPMATFALRAQR